MPNIIKDIIKLAISNAEIKAKGSFNPPSLDLKAIKIRADELDGKSQLKTDIFMLLLEVERLNNG